MRNVPYFFAIAATALAVVFLVNGYGAQRFKAGYDACQNKVMTMALEGVAENNKTIQKTKDEIQKLDDADLDARLASLGIMRPDKDN